MVATAQHLTDLAIQLSDRGHSVTVVTGDRGYNDPGVRFKREEVWKGISILRIPSLSWGKNTRWKRAVNFSSFLLMCGLRLFELQRQDVVIALTSPPLISVLGALYVRLKGGRLCCWIMDLNPDEAIAAGWLRDNSISAKALKRMMNFSLQRADQVVVLDRFMKERLRERVREIRRISVVPPWPLSDVVSYSSNKRRAFRQKHGLEDKFVVMYSGNHSPCHPLDTLLNAASNLRARSDVIFCFVGGGSEYFKVQRFSELHRLSNVKCLPYQPLTELSASLSAADLHVVVVGNPFVGILHASKIYNILEVRSRILYIGPEESHITDLAAKMYSGQLLAARHGDSSRVVHLILTCLERAPLEFAHPVSDSKDGHQQRSVSTAVRNHNSPHAKEALEELCQIIETDADLRLPITQGAAESVF